MAKTLLLLMVMLHPQRQRHALSCEMQGVAVLP
jgi:hypothetical protein